jgi:phage repressor protein C with HTH and peptisase S24 domain
MKDLLMFEDKNPNRAILDGRITRFGERLRKAIRANGDSNVSFATKCGMSERVIRDYLSGKTYPSLERLGVIAKMSGKPLEWLAIGMESNDNGAIEKIDLMDSVKVSKLVTHQNQSNNIGEFVLTKEWLTKEGLINKKLALVDIIDDSMENALSEGDIVLISIKENKNCGDLNGLYVIAINDLVMVKRLQYDLFKNGYHIKSDNPIYDSYFVENNSDIRFKVIGKVERIFKKP